MVRLTKKPQARKPAPNGNPKRPGRAAAPWPAPASLGHQKLQHLGLAAPDIAKAVGGPEAIPRGWLRENSVPVRKYQDRLRGLYGIQWADWTRRPVVADDPAELAAEGLDLPTAPDATAPEMPEPDLSGDSIAGLENLLARTITAQAGATGSAQAALFTNERSIRVKLAELRAKRLTRRDELRADALLQGYYRVAVEILRPALGDDWPVLVERIGRAWDQVGEDGSLPEGFEP